MGSGAEDTAEGEVVLEGISTGLTNEIPEVNLVGEGEEKTSFLC